MLNEKVSTVAPTGRNNLITWFRNRKSDMKVCTGGALHLAKIIMNKSK